MDTTFKDSKRNFQKYLDENQGKNELINSEDEWRILLGHGIQYHLYDKHFLYIKPLRIDQMGYFYGVEAITSMKVLVANVASLVFNCLTLFRWWIPPVDQKTEYLIRVYALIFKKPRRLFRKLQKYQLQEIMDLLTYAVSQNKNLYKKKRVLAGEVQRVKAMVTDHRLKHLFT